MLNIILLENYNNYFNRIVKFNKDVVDYISKYNYRIIDKVNFNPRDGVNATHICNMDKENNFVPDYMLLVDSTIDNFGRQQFEILSRWFVTEWQFSTGTQYVASLRRDVIADNYDRVITAPTFIEKGMINNASNPLIYNNEGMTFNEIKKNEILLKDETKIGWLVGYMIQKFPDTETSKKFTAEYSYFENAEAAIDYTEVENQGIHINFNPNYHIKTIGSTIYQSLRTVRKAVNYQPGFTIKIKKDQALPVVERDTGKEPMQWIPLWNSNLQPEPIRQLMQTWANSYKDKISRFIRINYADKEGTLENNFIETFNKKLVSKDGKTYRLEMTKKDINYPKRFSGDPKNQQLIKAFQEIVSYSPKLYEQFIYPVLDNASKHVMDLEETISEYEFRAIPVEASSAGIEVEVKSTRNHLSDAPYDMFCIPYDKDNKEQTEIEIDNVKFNISNIFSLVMARGMAVSGGGLGTSSTYVYDIQYLPYCPIPELKQKTVLTFDNKGKRTFHISKTNGFTVDKDYSLIKKNAGDKETLSIMFWATNRSGTFNIPFVRNMPNDPLKVKVMNETEKLRLCSPNYAGLFDFVPVKNLGITNINVDFTYKPMNPYIHINPDFKGLYGDDYNDSRGLVVGGDFSLETLSDAFINYELQNKNYRQMFDREIENMDVNNSINLTSQTISATLGSVTAGVAGAAMGAKAGGIPGAIAGGASALVGSAIGGAADIALGQKAYRESRDFKTDMFGYRLGNIKALPRGLTKTTAFTYNHKVFPFIEEYDCTDIEKEALENKIKYNGMTVMVVSQIGKFINHDLEGNSFIKGQIIRLNDLCEDSHIAQAIYEEINKGVFF